MGRSGPPRWDSLIGGRPRGPSFPLSRRSLCPLSAARRAAHLSTATRSTSYVRTSLRREYTMTRGPACIASGPCRSSVSGMQASDATSSGTGTRPSKTSTRAARCYLTCATGTATPCCSRWTSRSQPRPWRQSRPASPRWKAHSRNAPARIRRRTCSCVPTTRHDRMVTVVGRIQMDARALRIETNSQARVDALRERIEAPCGSRIRHRARAHGSAGWRSARMQGNPREPRRRPHPNRRSW